MNDKPKRYINPDYRTQIKSGEPNGTTIDTRDKLQRQADFLVAAANLPRITQAARQAQVTMSEVQRWKKDDVLFRERLDQARSQAAELIEDEATRRAVEGVSVPVYYAGRIVGYKREYSDSLLAKLLDGAFPDKYKGKDRGVIDTSNAPILIIPASGRELNQEGTPTGNNQLMPPQPGHESPDNSPNYGGTRRDDDTELDYAIQQSATAYRSQHHTAEEQEEAEEEEWKSQRLEDINENDNEIESGT